MAAHAPRIRRRIKKLCLRPVILSTDNFNFTTHLILRLLPHIKGSSLVMDWGLSKPNVRSFSYIYCSSQKILQMAAVLISSNRKRSRRRTAYIIQLGYELFNGVYGPTDIVLTEFILVKVLVVKPCYGHLVGKVRAIAFLRNMADDIKQISMFLMSPSTLDSYSLDGVGGSAPNFFRSLKVVAQPQLISRVVYKPSAYGYVVIGAVGAGRWQGYRHIIPIFIVGDFS